MIIDRINQDLKKAMLARDEEMVSVLRGLKSSVQYATVGQGDKADLADQEVITVLQKEAKKRQEAAELYDKGGNQELKSKELKEKLIIEEYLPRQLSKDELSQLVDEAVGEIGEATNQNMGQIIGRAKQKAGGAADGALLAELVKKRIQN